MPLSKTLVQSFRKNELLVGAGWRSYFAPYNAALGSSVANTVLGPTILDLQTLGPFNTYTPPAGWTDLGWIKDAKVTPQSKIGNVRSGYRGAIRTQYRGQVGEQVEFKFREATRMAFKISMGNTPFNLTATSNVSTAGPLSASGAAATAISAYAPGPPATLTVASVSGLAIGNYIVCDDDYTGQTGLVGAAGVPVQPGQVTDVDYIRKTSDFVARITGIAGNVLTLDQPFTGGGNSTAAFPNGQFAPAIATAKVQRITGFAVREGATFITEWSGLFLIDTVDGCQIAIYYPHLAINQFRDINAWAIENAGTTDETGYDLDCVLDALAFDDPIDGETVVGYKALYMRPNANIAI